MHKHKLTLIVEDYRFKASLTLPTGEKMGLLDTEEGEYDWGKAFMAVLDFADPVSDNVTSAPGIITIETIDYDRWLRLIPRIARRAERY